MIERSFSCTTLAHDALLSIKERLKTGFSAPSSAALFGTRRLGCKQLFQRVLWDEDAYADANGIELPLIDHSVQQGLADAEHRRDFLDGVEFFLFHLHAPPLV